MTQIVSTSAIASRFSLFRSSKTKYLTSSPTHSIGLAVPKSVSFCVYDEVGIEKRYSWDNISFCSENAHSITMHSNFDIYVNKSSNILIIPFENTSPSGLLYMYS